jgi:hypothetical protein
LPLRVTVPLAARVLLGSARWVGPLGCIDLGWDFKNRERETKVSWAGPSLRTSVPRLSEDEARTVATIPYRNRKR